MEGNGTMMGLLRRVAGAMGVAALCWTTGCAGFWVAPGTSTTGTGSTTGDYVYVANATVETVSGFAVGTGTLAPVRGSPVSLGFAPTALAVNPANSILFVGGNSAIYAFAINSSTGALSALNGGTAVGNAAVASMDISPDGRWLFVLDQNEITLEEFQINSTTGVLTQNSPITYPAPSGATVVARAVKVAPSGNYVFLALGTAGDVVYPLTTTNGALSTPLSLSLGAASTNSDNALAVSPDSTLLFIARSGPGGGLAVYTIGSGGALAGVSGSPFTAGTQPFSVVVNAAGTDVYVANRGDGMIAGFSIASGGALTTLSGSPYPSGTAVTALAVDNSKNYLLAAANGGSSDLTMYSYDSTTTGKLDLSAATATGTGPVAIAATH
jgi:6-phosphogluconolactonase (cycloisomerase 2 family)